MGGRRAPVRRRLTASRIVALELVERVGVEQVELCRCRRVGGQTGSRARMLPLVGMGILLEEPVGGLTVSPAGYGSPG